MQQQYERFLVNEVAHSDKHASDPLFSVLHRLVHTMGPEEADTAVVAITNLLRVVTAMQSPDCIMGLFTRMEVGDGVFVTFTCLCSAACVCSCSTPLIGRLVSRVQDALVPPRVEDQEQPPLPDISDVGQPSLIARETALGVFVRRIILQYTSAMFSGVSRLFDELSEYTRPFAQHFGACCEATVRSFVAQRQGRSAPLVQLAQQLRNMSRAGAAKWLSHHTSFRSGPGAPVAHLALVSDATPVRSGPWLLLVVCFWCVCVCVCLFVLRACGLFRPCSGKAVRCVPTREFAYVAGVAHVWTRPRVSFFTQVIEKAAVAAETLLQVHPGLPAAHWSRFLRSCALRDLPRAEEALRAQFDFGAADLDKVPPPPPVQQTARNVRDPSTPPP